MSSHLVGFTAAQLQLLALLWVVAGLLPALPVAWHARERGDSWVAWGGLVATTSVLGIVAYWEHVRIQDKRARRAREGGPPDEGGGTRGGKRTRAGGPASGVGGGEPTDRGED